MAQKLTYRDVVVHRIVAPDGAQHVHGSRRIEMTASYSRVMERVGDAMAQGATVKLEHRIVTPNLKGAPVFSPYDVIDVDIEWP